MNFTYTGNSIVGNILANDTIDDNPIEFPNDDINIEAEEPTDTAPYHRNFYRKCNSAYPYASRYLYAQL